MKLNDQMHKDSAGISCFKNMLQDVEWNIFEPKWHLSVWKVNYHSQPVDTCSASYIHLPQLGCVTNFSHCIVLNIHLNVCLYV